MDNHKWSLFGRKRGREEGQALIEYALILVLVVFALIAALIATGPAIGNVFSNTVYNLLGQTTTPQDVYAGGGPTAFWLTVTAVATNPPNEEPLPPVEPKPPTNTPTEGPSLTPTEVVPTLTPSLTPTDPPTATPTDHVFEVPHIDPIDQPAWWRVDDSVYLGGDDWLGKYYATTDLSGVANTKWNAELGIEHKGNIAFDWGTGGPIAGWNTDNFSVEWTRHVYVAGPDPITVTFSILSDAGVRFWVDTDPLVDDWNGGRTFATAPIVRTHTLTPGDHIFRLRYFETSGPAGIFLNISQAKGNVNDDTNHGGGNPNCTWGRITGSQPNTLAWAWTANPTGEFAYNLRCNLELRGYLNMENVPNPVLSFWDVWDFEGATTARLRIAEYVPYNADGTGGPNWAAAPVIDLHTGGSRNYAWNRYQIDLSSYNFASNRLTYRFTLDSQAASAGGRRRWFIDDLHVKSNDSREFTVCRAPQETCGSYWNMDATQQLNDFIASGRWTISPEDAYGGAGMALNDSPTYNYNNFASNVPSNTAATDYRVHYVEFNGTVNLTDIQITGEGGQPDFEGDEGFPKLSFFHSYAIDRGERLEIQWTRDAKDSIADNWATLAVIRDNTSGSGAVSDSWRPVEVRLDAVPNWYNTQFRLRFAMYVNRDNTSQDGWKLDEVMIDREGLPRYAQYPFCDNAENGTGKWLMTGTWGTTTTTPSGVFNSARAFTDSPIGNYRHGTNDSMEQKYVIDYMNDSPENQTIWGGNKNCQGDPSGAATNPELTFWHWRRVANSESIHVDIMRPANSNSGTTAIPWTSVWSYNYISTSSTQVSWEHVRIDMRAAIQTVTGTNWDVLRTTGTPHDDDFMFRIRLNALSSSSVSDGIYIDEINLTEKTETAFRLWSTGAGGNGLRYRDTVESPPAWWLRWNTGGDWTAVDFYAKTTNANDRAFHDSQPIGTRYRHGSYSVLEMNTIIDLTDTDPSLGAMLYFWTRFEIGRQDLFEVQVTVEDPTRTRQGYDYIYGWGTAQSYAGDTPNGIQPSSWRKLRTIRPLTESQWKVDTWVREQADLSEYIGNRVRIRFVVDAYRNSSSLGDGWYIDDVVVESRAPRIHTIPFIDTASNTSNWITEGSWGLAPDLWKGSGGGPAALGSAPWFGYFFDCVNQTTGALFNCDNPTRANQVISFIAPTKTAMDAYAATYPNRSLIEVVANIDYDFGSTGTPPGALNTTWFDYFTARWIRDITVDGGEYTFVTTSDDGVRLRYIGPGTPTDPNDPNFWNIISNWTNHSKTTNINTITLDPGDYQLVMEYYENNGSAVIKLSVGNNNFSFSDSPKASAADSFPAIASTRYGDSSLLLDGVLDLFRPSGMTAAQWQPKMQFYTYYQLGSNNFARVEVSTDGGFSWNTAGLRPNTTNFEDPVIAGWSDWMPANGDWRLRRHSLKTYEQRYIGLRFKLVTTDSVRDGWWITELEINN